MALWHALLRTARPARLRACAAAVCVPLLSGCDLVLLNPAGDIAVRQSRLIVISTLLMLLIIVPVIVLTLAYAWHFRQSNRRARYEPEWDHSIQLELVIWAAPLMIIIALGAITWITTHTLDPFRPLETADNSKDPLEVEAIALDWKWLFIYPDQRVAVVNELAAPVDVPIRFRITAESVMNAFFVPALAGQIFAMPGMQTQLHAIINRPGRYEGLSANYSGAGFSGMHFVFHGMSAPEFERWVQEARSAGGTLDRNSYIELRRPSQNDPVRRYGEVAPDLYDAIVNRCVAPGEACIRDLMSRSGHAGAAY